MIERIGRLLCVVLITAAVGVSFAHPAAAAAPPTFSATVRCPTKFAELREQYGGKGISKRLTASNDTSDPADTSSGTSYLPIERWSAATSTFHTRIDPGTLGFGSIPQRVSRDGVAPIGMSAGNAMWEMSVGLVGFANNFDILTKVGCTADSIAADTGDALMPLIALLVVVGFVSVLWRSRNDPSGAKDLVKIVAIIGVIGIMFMGAQQTRDTGTPGAGSPYWLADRTNALANAVLTPVVKGLTDSQPGIAGIAPSGGPQINDLNCTDYVRILHQRYASEQENDGKDGSMPVVLSALWESSGLTVWTGAQFGLSNEYVNQTYCHVLDRASGVSAGEQLSIIKGGGGGGASTLAGPGDAAKILRQNQGNNNTDDQAAVFFAECSYHGGVWKLDKAWKSLNGDGKAQKGDDCKDGWEKGDATKNSSTTKFDWGPGTGKYREANTGDADGPVNFLANWHGDDSSAAMALVMIYVFSSFINLIAFGVIALGVIIAKVAAVVMIAMIFLILCASIIPGRGPSKAAKFAKFWLGCSLYAFILQGVLAMLVIVTAFIAQMGTAALGQGSVMSIVWLGFAPVTAMIVLHLVMKNAVGTSVFKPGAALAMGAAVGGAGAAAGVGVDRMMRRGSNSVRRGVGHGVGQRMAGVNKKGGKPGKGGKHGLQPEDGAPEDEKKDEKPPLTMKQKIAQRKDDAAKRHAGRNAVVAAGGSRSERAKNWAKSKKSNGAQRTRSAVRRAGANAKAHPFKTAGKALLVPVALGAAAISFPATAGALGMYAGYKKRKSRHAHKQLHGVTPRQRKHEDAYAKRQQQETARRQQDQDQTEKTERQRQDAERSRQQLDPSYRTGGKASSPRGS